MKILLKTELKKALKNKAFLASVIISILLTILSLIFCVSIYNRDMRDMELIRGMDNYSANPDISIYSLFNHWIGGESMSLGSSVYFFIFPILCAMPYGWSYCVERKSGYTRTMVVLAGKKKYFAAKYIATFVSGGLAVVIPFIINIAMTACFFPAIKPEIENDIYYAVFKNGLMSELFYSKPFLYLFFYLIIDFVFCGLLADISLAAASFIKQKYVTVMIPFVVCLLIHLSTKFIYDAAGNYSREISPFYYLRATDTRLPASFAVIGVTAFIIFVVTFVITNIWERKHEIY